jgi:hypothetical protein
VIAAPTRPVTVWVAGEIVAVPVTVIVTFAVADDVPSVAVTVKSVATDDSVGVPEMTPVEVFNDKPAGSEGETAKTLVPVIPVTV